MKIAILHQDLEWVERHIQREMRLRGHDSRLVDVRRADDRLFDGVELVLNRVYASVANRNWRDNLRLLELLGRLEAAGVTCINSLAASRADYDKHLSARLMTETGVPTPRTLLLHSLDDHADRSDEINDLGYPLVVKRNMGGRAKGIRRAGTEGELLECLGQAFSPDGLREYAAGMVVQPYLQSVRPYDIRVAVVRGQPIHSRSRILVPALPGETPWIGSRRHGSRTHPYFPGEEEIALAIRATEAIGATINEVDMIETRAGFVVIENNPTPSFKEHEGALIAVMLDRLLRHHAGGRPPRRDVREGIA